jgi:hypothetical protein
MAWLLQMQNTTLAQVVAAKICSAWLSQQESAVDSFSMES